ncbi:ABC transporter ATP-binding protein [Thermosediminibacter oceani]|uniref:ABC transporter related protein n=1 Tax=Thermosediminibacter oceani (strain ATCC BAA-1034 / DSM 16646 / JW/IW-1228P) TaxID=555079 RepID=D9RYI5_THEOJ|nr:ABC transporter ATP-binding protein [Thermosediminibacter oceani]ADL08409.1 ABC transporter related protein [Thermosediminibacter oceani DSM 16646]
MIKLLKFLKPYRNYVIVSLILIFFQSISELYLPNLMSDIVDIGIVKGDIRYILQKGEIMLLVAAGGTVSAIVASYLSSQAAMGFGKILRNKIFSQVENFSLQEFDKFGTASLITRTTNDVNQIQMVIMITLRMVARAPLICIGGIILAVSKDARLSLILLITVPILAFLVFVLYKKAMPLFDAIQKKIDRVNLILRENLTGIRVIRAFNKIEYEKKRFNEANIDLTNMSIKVNRIMAWLMPAMMLLLNFTIIAVIWFGGIRIDKGTMQVGDLMAFIQYIIQIMFSLIMVSVVFVMLPRASASALRINEVLEIVPKIKEPEKPEEIKNIRGVIEFKDVTFSYPGADEPALKNISFKAEPGKLTAIIGGTGSGKSTVLNLIMRFYDADSGSILIDGVDIKLLPQTKLRDMIGYVPQKAVLFSGTIADNIRFGKNDAADEQIRKAACIAQATEFIFQMKDEFNSEISQGGKNLSGGQKQRLAIARAVVKRPKIYLFDDCFSALDFKTDAKVRAALREETKDATVIVVAQRVATIMDADQIIVLQKGEIAGIGTHKQLLNTCQIYREIVLSQLSGEELI